MMFLLKLVAYLILAFVVAVALLSASGIKGFGVVMALAIVAGFMQHAAKQKTNSPKD
jgi:hypothetical protein